MGIALMCCAGLSLTGIDAVAKFLNHHMDSLEVVWARYTSAFLLALTVSNPLTRPGLMVTKRPLLQLTRSLLMVGGTLLNVIALRYLQIDQTYSINFTTPMLVAALAGPLLGEWIGWRRWIAIMVGFVGVLLVIRPGFGGIHWAAFLSLGTAVCYAFYGIATRRLSRSDSNETQLFYGNLVGAGVTSAVVWLVWTTPQSLLIVVLMLATGAFGSLGHYPADRRPPAGAGLADHAVHVSPADLGRDLRLPGVRSASQRLDPGRRRHRHRVGPLYFQSRAQGPCQGRDRSDAGDLGQPLTRGFPRLEWSGRTAAWMLRESERWQTKRSTC